MLLRTIDDFQFLGIADRARENSRERVRPLITATQIMELSLLGIA
jgi:hypothetical protein